MELGLDAKAALVAGGSRGIGLAVAREFLSEGADVAIVARGEADLEAARAELAAAFPNRTIVTLRGDMRRPDDVEAVVAGAVDALGRLDCAVASAGSGRGPADWRVDPEDWRAILDENLMSAVFLCQSAAARMTAGGALVVIGSIAGLGEAGGPLPYTVAKSALVRYVRGLARRLAPGVRVNLVAPGNVVFPGGRWEELLAEDREGVERLVRDEVPMQRFGTPAEIAAAVVFLCSERASFVTGACLVADGGQLR